MSDFAFESYSGAGTAFGRVAVLMGGTSAEREVSLMSGNGVLAALKSRGVDAHAFDPATEPMTRLKDQGVSRCFIALHGRLGEDGTVQGALELLGLPYTGSGVMASAMAMDKLMTKRLWLADGLATPRFVKLNCSEINSALTIQNPPLPGTLLETAMPGAIACGSPSAPLAQPLPTRLKEVLRQLGLPLFVKPPHEGSSIGISKVSAAHELLPALQLAAQYGDEVLCESFVSGWELTCPLLGSGEAAVALPVVRIEAAAGQYDYHNKYFTNTTRYHTGMLTPEQETAVRQLALAAYRSLGCRGWGRADVKLDGRTGVPSLLEMNTSPGMTSHSLVPISAKAAGLSYDALCLQILQLATLDSASTVRRTA